VNETEHSDSFVLKIDFEKDSARPSRVFRAMSELIEGFQSLDNDLVQTFPVKVSPILMLEDIQIGSLRTVMKNVLTGIDDEALKNLEWKKMIGGFLVQGKHAVLQWIEQREQIESRKALEELAQKLRLLAEGTKILHLPHYSPPPLPLLIRDLAMIGEATRYLGPNDVATYESEGETSSFNKKFHVDAEFAEELLTDETISNRSEVLLRVKKPDYLGESMWDFVHAGHGIRAKIEDHDWLVQFQFQRIQVLPGDALRVQLETTTHHGSDGSEIMTYYRILKVLAVKRASNGTQMELPPSTAQ
jgi:hypothetical protein